MLDLHFSKHLINCYFRLTMHFNWLFRWGWCPFLISEKTLFINLRCPFPHFIQIGWNWLLDSYYSKHLIKSFKVTIYLNWQFRLIVNIQYIWVDLNSIPLLFISEKTLFILGWPCSRFVPHIIWWKCLLDSYFWTPFLFLF